MWTVWFIIAIYGLYMWSEHREEERRRTQPERIARQMRDLEHEWLIAWGAEDHLRAMLLDDLRQIHGHYKAVEYVREHYGIEFEWPTMRMPEPPSPWAWMARCIPARFSRRWAAR